VRYPIQPVRFLEACLRLPLCSRDGEMRINLVAAGQRPMDPVPFYHLADACRAAGVGELWHEGVRIAFALPHQTPEQVYLRGKAKLRLGDWTGWADYDQRQSHPDSTCTRSRSHRELHWRHKVWDGHEDLSALTVLVVPQGGFGDTIQMLRFVPALIARAKHVVLAVQAALVTFVAHNFGAAATVIPAERAVDIWFDRYVHTMSLPSHFGSLPAFTPLLSGAADRQHASRDVRHCLRIGVCWACRSGVRNEEDRRIPIAVLAPLFGRPNVEWWSLQVGERATEGKAYCDVVEPKLESFQDTADVIAALDCVVTVDTAVAHLAGSLGAPTLLALSCAASWRWGLGDSTAWYPTLCISRQQVPGDWGSVLNTIASVLENGNTPPRQNHAW
jgi:hypothetical protein